MNRSAVVWPAGALPELLDVMTDRTAGIVIPAPPPDTDMRRWMDTACAARGVEPELRHVRATTMDRDLTLSAPAVIEVDGGWVGLKSFREDAVLCGIGGHNVRVAGAQFTDALLAPHGRAECEKADGMIRYSGVSGSRGERARRLLVRELMGQRAACSLWTLRTSPGRGFFGQLKQAGVLRSAVWMALAHFAEYLIWIAAWYILGRDTLAGHWDSGWLSGWALTLAFLVPLRVWTTWLQGTVSISAGGLLRQRLLDGILHLAPDEIRKEGAGQFFGRVMETGQIESLALSGGLVSALALIELVLSGLVLAEGAAPFAHLIVEGFILAATLALGFQYWRRRSAWTETRLRMTQDLVQNMTGHRTRVSQLRPEEWHQTEDRAIRDYVRCSRSMDQGSAALNGLLPRLWTVLGIAAMAPSFLGAGAPVGLIAVSMGGVLLAGQALRRLTSGIASLSGAAIAWRQVAPLFHASLRNDAAGVAVPASSGQTVLDARSVSFGYEGRARQVLRDANLHVRRGDWLLLEGESGGGKSTLVSVLTGLRDAAGLVLLNGLDRKTMGSRQWRSRIAVAPQYHENHVLSAPLACNLLMGRQWPPQPEDMQEADDVCSELGLRPLIERMPGGLMQMVGETGWQLSQGERSRLFIARSLLQNAELVVLDESFGALDPETLRLALECVLKRAGTLLVVAHP